MKDVSVEKYYKEIFQCFYLCRRAYKYEAEINVYLPVRFYCVWLLCNIYNMNYADIARLAKLRRNTIEYWEIRVNESLKSRKGIRTLIEQFNLDVLPDFRKK